MTTVPTCPHESDVLDLAAMGRWPDGAEASLRAHVATCRTCADVAIVAGSLANWQDATLAHVRVPDAGVVWRQAERRARADATRRATQPVLAVEVAAVAAIVLLAVAWGPALAAFTGPAPWASGWLTASWQTVVLLPSAIGTWWQTPGWPVSVTSTLRWGLLTLAAWAVLLPLAFSLAELADRLPRPRDRHSGPVG
jgi:hypothetical protein